MPSSIPSTLLHSSRLSSPSRSFTPLIAPKAPVVCDGHHRPGSLRPPLHSLMTEFGCRVLADIVAKVFLGGRTKFLRAADADDGARLSSPATRWRVRLSGASRRGHAR